MCTVHSARTRTNIYPARFLTNGLPATGSARITTSHSRHLEIVGRRLIRRRSRLPESLAVRLQIISARAPLSFSSSGTRRISLRLTLTQPCTPPPYGVHERGPEPATIGFPRSSKTGWVGLTSRLRLLQGPRQEPQDDVTSARSSTAGKDNNTAYYTRSSQPRPAPLPRLRAPEASSSPARRRPLSTPVRPLQPFAVLPCRTLQPWPFYSPPFSTPAALFITI